MTKMSIDPKEFYNLLSSCGIKFYAGVPDSLLKEFCFFLDDNISSSNHIITANEGCAIALASGFYLADRNIPLVYMQNSGIGNAINPLLSLCDPQVYSIPMIVMIGWRGEPGTIDEPQHVKQGKVQTSLFEAMDIPYKILSNNSNYEKNVREIINKAKKNSRPCILLVRKKTFKKYNKTRNNSNNYEMKREDVLKILLNKIDKKSVIVSTTGKTSREIFEIREQSLSNHDSDFLTVGSMGHCSSIALGVATAKPEKKVFCIDGDGSMIMHMGGIASVADLKPKNFKYILLNNQVHESVGGQSTSAKDIDLYEIAKKVGFINTIKVTNKSELIEHLNEFLLIKGPSFMEVMIKPGSRSDLGRPTIEPKINKKLFMNFLAE